MEKFKTLKKWALDEWSLRAETYMRGSGKMINLMELEE